MSYQFDKQNFWDYIINMKTSIKVPESLYSEVERIAADLGIPGSQVFTEALEDFIKKHAKENITEKLNGRTGSSCHTHNNTNSCLCLK